MATKVQMMELQNQISNLKWELEKKDKDHQYEIDKLKLEHQAEMEELKKGMMPMTRNDVIEIIKDNLKIRMYGGYNGYVEGMLFFGDECFISDSDHVCDGSNPLDE